ncbi:PAS domain-containing protein [Aquincola sp. J276]|uniref:PAS domain-containing protein n=1 Tax=Aquincola sp. J276 TaxID=2898432 RepID=UPI002151988A|nr:PAS domain-containing protein [Aquincola sp. J276]MCR5868151.1 PAS domain-containing protein [Aquincola sp. J276]
MLSTALAAVLTTVVVVELFARRHAEAQAESTLRQIAWNLRDALDHGMAQHYEQVKVLSALDVFRTGSSADIRRTLNHLKLSFPQYAWVGLTDSRGRVIASSEGLLEGADVAKRPWFGGAQQGMYVGDVHPAVLLEKLLPVQNEPWRFVDVAAPVYGAEGELRGVLGAHLSWGWAREVHARLLDPALATAGAEVLIVASNGKVLLGPPGLEGTDLPKGTLEAASKERLRITIFKVQRLQHQRVFAAVAPTKGDGAYPGLGWQVLVRQPEAQALADYQALRNDILRVGAIVALLSGAAAVLIAKLLATPLRRLARHLNNDEPVRIERIGLFREARQLAEALQRSAERQHRLMTELQDANELLERRVAQRTQVLQETNQQLVDAEQLVKGIANGVPALIGYFDREERCRFANEPAARRYGHTSESVRGLRLQEVLDEQLYAEHAPHIRQALVGEPSHFETTVWRAGRQLHFKVNVVPACDDAQVVNGFYLMTMEVTALAEARQAAAASALRLRTIADNLPVLIAYYDRDLTVQFCNATFKEWVGIDPANAIGRPLRTVIGDTLFNQRRSALQRALAGEQVRFEMQSTALGTTRDLDTTYVPHIEEGRVVGVYSLSSEVTALKEGSAAWRHWREWTCSPACPTGVTSWNDCPRHWPVAVAVKQA